MGKAKIDGRDIAAWNHARIEFLKEVVGLFDTYNIKYWLDGGSLLGLVRDNEIIAQDSDHDCCVKVEDLNENFFKMFDDLIANPRYETDGIISCHNFYKQCFNSGSIKPMKALFGNYYKIELKEKFESSFGAKKIYCDLFIVFPFEDFYFYKLSLNTFRFKGEHLKDLKKINRYGLDITIPNHVEDYLDVQYTERWRMPDKFNAYKTVFWHNWIEVKTELPKDYCYKINSVI